VRKCKFQDSVPLFEKLKFLAITTSNLDEFFCKRVGGLMRQRAVGMENLRKKMKKRWSPAYQLELISKVIPDRRSMSHSFVKEVRKMLKWQSDIFYNNVLPKFKEEGYRILRYSDMNTEGLKHLSNVFKNEIEALLTPIKLDPGHPFPHLPSNSASLAVLLEDPRDIEQKLECAIINVPSSLQKWRSIDPEYSIEGQTWTTGFMPIEEIISHHVSELFGGMKVVGVHPFRVTRNADIARNEEEAEDLLAMIAAELRERK